MVAVVGDREGEAAAGELGKDVERVVEDSFDGFGHQSNRIPRSFGGTSGESGAWCGESRVYANCGLEAV